jgi:hypothetical protein
LIQKKIPKQISKIRCRLAQAVRLRSYAAPGRRFWELLRGSNTGFRSAEAGAWLKLRSLLVPCHTSDGTSQNTCTDHQPSHARRIRSSAIDDTERVPVGLPQGWVIRTSFSNHDHWNIVDVPSESQDNVRRPSIRQIRGQDDDVVAVA